MYAIMIVLSNFYIYQEHIPCICEVFIYYSMIVNLSHLLLSKIVCYLEDNIDRICVSLVCKRLFEERVKYLYFNTDNINIIDNQEDEVFTLKSYRSLIFRSLKQKRICIMSIGGSRIRYDSSIDPFTHLEDPIDIITPNISTVKIDQKLGKKHTENLYRMISDSKVYNLKGISRLSSVLPVNLTSITFHYEFNKVLLAGYLPPKLKKLKFDTNSYFNQTISAGVLPNTLKKLKFGECFDQVLEPHVLPSSLTYLELGYNYTQTLQVGSLPPNLLVFNHYGEIISEISDGVLPQSLCTLQSVPLSWIPFIKSLNNLTKLKLYQSDNSIVTIDLSDLPGSLTDLAIYASCHLTSSLSPSIRYLDIHETEYDIDEIFKDRSQYHFERLCVDGNKQESLDNLKINELRLEFDKRESILRYIPFGVESLFIGHQNFEFYTIPKLNLNGIPSSVKKITFQSNILFNQLDFEIPNNVEEVMIQNIYLDDQFSSEWIPNSVKSLTIPSNLFQKGSTPISVTNLFLTNVREKLYLQVRKIYDNHYLIFGKTNDKFKAAIVSQLFLSDFIDKK
ncbi:hypothetical protein PPL_06536 [Heterostelium album PN500]|uniref:FNIP repeat-containing protein n=1 Tax=Heterostelium pallidum (strain ATCC 26659 / Pp 5 / PN500) TaxID=670386 RepID=D3BDF3_HETP5|nr:hypothetical protein PPL_06536 [Heterostelium album PN500]EFA80597.1 hypothetical protein PPL_06536 [Heterostelium album PN500]|eukprot:XP_020432717.1 hypothetical protein PPL_06536 [Heterostelium album PN500]